MTIDGETGAGDRAGAVRPTTAHSPGQGVLVVRRTPRRWVPAVVVPPALAPLWLGPVRQGLGSEPALLWTFAGLVLVLLLLTSAWTDLRWGKIYNGVTYPALGWALALNVAASLFGRSGPDGAWLGAVGVADCLFGSLACFLPMLLNYHASGGGAGDVKLATALGALLGLRNGVLALLTTYVVAGAAILAWLIWTLGPWFLVRTLGRWLGSLIFPGLVAPPDRDQAGLLRRPVRLGPFYAIGGLSVLGGAFAA